MPPKRLKGNNEGAPTPSTSSSSKPKATKTLKGRLGIEQHPMTNPVILSAIFDVCPVTQLKTIRLVCKQWRDLSLGRWRRQAVLQIECEFSGRRPNDDSMPRWYLNNLRKLPRIEEKPFSSCEISGPFSDYVRVGPALLQLLSFENLTYLKLTFKSLCISYVRDLVFSDSSPPLKTFILYRSSVANHELRDIRDGQKMEDFFPKTNLTLTCFEVDNVKWRIGGRTPNWSMDDFIRAFLIRAPNITTLVAPTYITDVDASQLKIRSLDVWQASGARPCPVPFLNILRELPLVELKLNLEETSTAEDLRKVFGNNCDSLERLHTYQSRGGGSADMAERRARNSADKDKISFPELRQLHMFQGLNSAFHFLHLVSCPKLNEVTLFSNFEGSNKALDVRRLQQFVMRGVTKLKILARFGSAPLPQNEMEVLASVFPNLQDLRMPMQKAQFPVICKAFPKLRCLHIITFLPRPGCGCCNKKKDLRELVDDEAITGMELDPEPKRGIEKKPNLTDLKELVEFCVEPQALENDERVYLTDYSVNNGFLRMPGLRILRFNMDKVSKKAKKALQEKVFVADNYPYPPSWDY